MRGSTSACVSGRSCHARVVVADLADLIERRKLWIWKAREDTSDSSSMLVGRFEVPAVEACAGTGVEDFETVRELLAEDDAVGAWVCMKRAVCARSCLRLFQF